MLMLMSSGGDGSVELILLPQIALGALGTMTTKTTPQQVEAKLRLPCPCDQGEPRRDVAK